MLCNHTYEEKNKIKKKTKEGVFNFGITCMKLKYNKSINLMNLLNFLFEYFCSGIHKGPHHVKVKCIS